MRADLQEMQENQGGSEYRIDKTKFVDAFRRGYSIFSVLRQFAPVCSFLYHRIGL